MARAQVKKPEEYLLRLSRLGSNIDTVAEKMLNAGGEVVLDKIKSNLSEVIGSETKERSRSTGELLRSLGLSSVKQDRDGNLNIKVGFSEPRSDGSSNAKIAAILEYGKTGQPPKPFLKPAKTSSRRKCIDAMKRVLDEEVGDI